MRCALVAMLRIFAGEFQIRRAKRVISTVDIETAGLWKAFHSCNWISLSVTASRTRVV